MVRLTKELMEDWANRPQCPKCGSHFVVKDGKKSGSVALLPMLNTNSDLVVLKNKL